jgi:methylated-DNA-[protein]-cysteine S-methyltransferase
MTQTVEIVIAHPLGLRLHWREGLVRRMELAWAEELGQGSASSGAAGLLTLALARYVAGEPAGWPELPLDYRGLPGFNRRVLEELAAQVRPGEKVTYGELAARCGCPRGARAVGQVMARNPFPLIYPCHRVLAAGGRLGGFGPGLRMKQWLLELEGAL